MLTRAVDLSSCDNEPIHTIGGVQPFGALVAFDAATGLIGFASTNTDRLLGREFRDLLGKGVDTLLDARQLAELLARPLRPSMPDLLRPWFLSLPGGDGVPLAAECYPHQHDGRIILEFVARESGPALMWEEDALRQRIIAELIKPETLTELAHVGAEIIREITGFDRVMIYRFAPDKHGEVIAESTSRHDSFLGLHYPASDIPDPARRHFLLNLIRIIPDINATPVPITTVSGKPADALSDTPLDLTFSKLRAVAPVHVEYLNNMGVGGSMSISLTSNNALWGLVACHHYGPHSVSWSRLRFCELLGGTISALLQSLENTAQLRHSIRAEKAAFDIEHEARSGSPLLEVIRRHSGLLIEQCGAEGLVANLGGSRLEIGKAPRLETSLAALKRNLVDGIATTDSLAELLGHAPEAGVEPAGAAMIELSDDGQDWLVFTRNAFEETIRWAGKPEKIGATRDDGSMRLSPRGSFALWREERRGRSKPFTATDHEFLRITRRALFAMNSLDRERAAVAAQRAAEGEEARLRLVLMDAARSRSMGELASALAHELSQPLSAVTNYVNACRQEMRNFGLPIPAQVDRLMESAVSESSRAADLVRRLRSFIGQGEIVLETVDLHAVIRQGAELAFAASGDAAVEVVHEFDDRIPPLLADPIQLGQVVLNLVRNSLAAMEESSVRTIVLRTRRLADEIEVTVRDTGVGLAEETKATLFEPFHSSTTSGMGIGLSLCRTIVEAHGGRIWTEPRVGGADFRFTVKINGGKDG
jgi:light-regulated signal transduction histidine kinase (bacteriophytochrome)